MLVLLVPNSGMGGGVGDSAEPLLVKEFIRGTWIYGTWKHGTFIPQDVATGPHTGDFTRLSVLGLPGVIRIFEPTATYPHIGDFTRYTVVGLPGAIRTFSPKVEPVPGSTESTRYVAIYRRRRR